MGGITALNYINKCKWNTMLFDYVLAQLSMVSKKISKRETSPSPETFSESTAETRIFL